MCAVREFLDQREDRGQLGTIMDILKGSQDRDTAGEVVPRNSMREKIAYNALFAGCFLLPFAFDFAERFAMEHREICRVDRERRRVVD